jgi:hypothetical protein
MRALSGMGSLEETRHSMRSEDTKWIAVMHQELPGTQTKLPTTSFCDMVLPIAQDFSSLSWGSGTFKIPLQFSDQNLHLHSLCLQRPKDSNHKVMHVDMIYHSFL